MLEFSQPRLSAMAVKGDGVGTGIIVIGKPADLELTSTSESDDSTIQDATIVDDATNTSTVDRNNLIDDANG